MFDRDGGAGVSHPTLTILEQKENESLSSERPVQLGYLKTVMVLFRLGRPYGGCEKGI